MHRDIFILNHLISEELPSANDRRTSNSDPVTGQAAWYDVRVRISKDADQSDQLTQPQVEAVQRLPGQTTPSRKRISYFAGRFTRSAP